MCLLFLAQCHIVSQFLFSKVSLRTWVMFCNWTVNHIFENCQHHCVPNAPHTLICYAPWVMFVICFSTCVFYLFFTGKHILLCLLCIYYMNVCTYKCQLHQNRTALIDKTLLITLELWVHHIIFQYPEIFLITWIIAVLYLGPLYFNIILYCISDIDQCQNNYS